jgi:hypothetical protein
MSEKSISNNKEKAEKQYLPLAEKNGEEKILQALVKYIQLQQQK